MSILRFLFQTLCAFLQIKDRKHIEQNFHSVAGVYPRSGTWGCWVGQKLKGGDLRWGPLTAHSSLSMSFSFPIFFLFSFFLFASFLSFSVVMSLFDYFIHF